MVRKRFVIFLLCIFVSIKLYFIASEYLLQKKAESFCSSVDVAEKYEVFYKKINNENFDRHNKFFLLTKLKVAIYG
jgi:hypothetical protein